MNEKQLWTGWEVFRMVALYTCVGFLWGFAIFGDGHHKSDKNPEGAKIEHVNNQAFQMIADARGWTIENARIGSLSVQYHVRVGKTGPEFYINALTLLDPFDEYRTVTTQRWR